MNASRPEALLQRAAAERHELRPLTLSDVPAVARIHRLAFADSSLTRLGDQAVRRYYLWLLLGPHDAVPLGLFVGGALAGYCFGGVYRHARSGFLRENKLFLLGLVLTHPMLASDAFLRDQMVEAAQVLRRRDHRRPSAATSRRPKSFGILAIAVEPGMQGCGIGRALMAESERIACSQGFQAMKLTVHPDNQQAIRFYESLGWQQVLTRGTWIGRMQKPLAGKE